MADSHEIAIELNAVLTTPMVLSFESVKKRVFIVDDNKQRVEKSTQAKQRFPASCTALMLMSILLLLLLLAQRFSKALRDVSGRARCAPSWGKELFTEQTKCLT